LNREPPRISVRRTETDRKIFHKARAKASEDLAPDGETPNTKLQTPEKLQAPNSNDMGHSYWSLKVGASLGIWSLVFGVSPSGAKSSLALARAL